MYDFDNEKIEVIAPNLKKRLSGVTATIIRLLPIQAKKIGIVSVAPVSLSGVPQISFWRLFFLPRKRKEGSGYRVWHARRNTEMLLGLVLKFVFQKKLKMLFTSASQRKHSTYTKLLIRQMDTVISTSSATAKYLEVATTVIRHGIDLSDYSIPADRLSAWQKIDLPGKAGIGCFGRVRHQKGTDVFVNAMIELLPDYPDYTAVILGRATASHLKFQNELIEKVAKAGLSERIIFAGEIPVEDMAKWYQALSLFIAPQRWEGFGLTPLEAMACGVPVVATKVGAFPEIIENDKSGALVDINDVEAMVLATRKYLEEPRKISNHGRAAHERIVMHFDINREANSIIDVYRQLLD